MYTWGPSHFLFEQYLKNVILCKDRSIGIQKKKKKKEPWIRVSPPPGPRILFTSQFAGSFTKWKSVPKTLWYTMVHHVR